MQVLLCILVLTIAKNLQTNVVWNYWKKRHSFQKHEDVREETFFCYKSIYEGCREEETGNNSSFEIELTTVKFKFDSIKNRM